MQTNKLHAYYESSLKCENKLAVWCNLSSFTTSGADLIVWTNDRVTSWLSSLGIINAGITLDQSGLHGAVISLDADMDTPTLATMLQIPNSSIEARYAYWFTAF